ncbi:MAG: ABC-F family ATP-binding cassette domain-containing protein [Candidatus Eisenbacteria sp.]|nr:ABC-F family ATP-binding cassette domain-containing protein [Candidatus Eisenbacteria bacterium]
MIKVQGLSKTFGGQRLFRDASWFLGPRDCVALVGANGTGKTTLLRIVCGLESPDEGTVSKPKGLRVGYLAQTGFVIGEGTVREEAHRAFDEILELQEEQRRLGARLSRLEQGEASLQRLVARQSEIFERLSILGSHEVDRQVHAVLTGLGFRTCDFDVSVSTLSGGWQMRAALARVLLQKPQLLLLDEPTNHLDLEAREWLEGYLSDYPYAVVLVSHDRYFLDVTVSRVTEITDGRLEEYTGNYSAFEKESEKRLMLRQQAYERQQDEIRRLTRFIERFRYKNTKATQVQSRIKMLGKMKRLTPPETHQRSVVVPLPPCSRSGKAVLALHGARKAYGDNLVLRDVDLRILRGARVALVGPNGAGKSTLLRALAGHEQLDGGERMVGHNVNLAFFAQDHTAHLDRSLSVLDTVMRRAPNDFVPQVRRLLGGFLFSGDAVDKLVSVLSGGECNRLALACLFVRPSNLLLLDEPTNHLDIPSKDALLDALRAYEGTVVFVAHDRHFLASLADHVIEVGGGTVREHPGGYESYLWSCAKASASGEGSGSPRGQMRVLQAAPGDANGPPGRAGSPGAGSKAPQPIPATQGRQAQKRAASRLRRAERAVAQLEAEIADLEDRKRRFTEAMGSPEFFTNKEKAELYLQQLREVEEKLAVLYEQWEKLAGSI